LKGGWETRQFLARGDGSTKTFTLPYGDNISDFKAYVGSVTTVPVQHTALHGEDAVGTYYETFIKVSNTSDGPADYAQGTDWRHSINSDQNIDWSLGGKEPAQGATYYVTMSSHYEASPTDVVLNGDQITFATAPSANQAVFVEYIYGTHTSDCSSLAYQETNANDGGFDSIKIDTTYTSRYLGKDIGIGYDWLYGYPCFSQTLKDQTAAMLVNWSDYIRDHGYYNNSIASNYGAGGYDSRMLTAIALQNRTSSGPRLKSEMLAYRSSLLPELLAPSNGNGTVQGGHWAEGWNYAPLAIGNILTAATAYETAGWGSVDTERSWANEVIKALLMEQPTRDTIWPGGDIYNWPMPFPNKTLLVITASSASDPVMKANANWAIQNYSGSSSASDVGWEDFLFGDLNASTSYWSSTMPLQYLAPGVGFVAARKDWNYNSTWLSFQSGNLVPADHIVPQGQISINKGPDALLIVSSALDSLSYQDKNKYGNSVVIDDGGAGEQTYRYAQGYWYGNPGVLMNHFEGTPADVYAQGNYAAAYTAAGGLTDPAKELVRSVFYLRNPDYVIVYDRAGTTQPGYLKQLQWNFLNTPVLNGNSWTETVSSSKLFGSTYSDVALTTTVKAFTVGAVPAQEIDVNNAVPTSSVRYVTALQIASSSVGSMDTSTHIISSSNKLEGLRIGSYVVMFGRNGIVSGGDSYSVTAPSGATITHYISDLAPGTYPLTGANQASSATSPEGVLTFTTTGTGNPQIVTVGTGTSAPAPTVSVAVSATPQSPPPPVAPIVTSPIVTPTFEVGTRVETTAALNVREGPSIDKGVEPLCAQPLASLGTIISGPTTNGGYTWWNINYDTACDGWSVQNFLTPSAIAIGSITHTLSVGEAGDEVRTLQLILSDLGFYKNEITGYFGNLTRTAVINFQTANALDAVGVVGPKTRALLKEMTGSQYGK
jgi:hypothetical protein